MFTYTNWLYLKYTFKTSKGPPKGKILYLGYIPYLEINKNDYCKYN